MKKQVSNSSAESQRKYFQFAFPKDIKITQILDVFQDVTEHLNYSMVQCESTHAIAIKAKNKSFIQLLDCFQLFTSSNISAIKMTIHKNQISEKKICQIKSLTNNPFELKQFCKKFHEYRKNLTFMADEFLFGEDFQIVEQNINPYYLESYALYMFHKILTNTNSQLHHTIQHFLDNFESEERKCDLSVKMRRIVKLVDKIVRILSKKIDHNNEQFNKIMPFCKMCVEKFIFDKIYQSLWNFYREEYESFSESFQEKRTQIFQNLSTEEIFTGIGLRKHLWFNCQNQKPSLEIITKNYEKSINQMKKIKGTHSPRQKIKHCQIMFTQLKIAIFEQTKGQYQLYNIQDIIPMLILIALGCCMKNMKEEVQMMLDFIKFNENDFEGERRLLVNMLESYKFIVNDWKIGKKQT